MKQLIIAATRCRSCVSKTGVALLLVSLGAACGGSDFAGNDAGNKDGAPGADGNAGDSGTTADGTTADSGSAADSGTTADSGDSGAATDSGPFTQAVNLGAAGGYVILAKAGISTVPTSAITGNLGISPATAAAITGFALKADSTNLFDTSSQVTGKVYAPGNAQPTPSNLITAIDDMQTAFTDAAGRAPKVTGLGAGDIGGLTLTPGVYKWGTALLIPTDITLTGSATDVWIFQIAQNLTLSNGTKIVLSGGAVPKNVFWQVSGSTDIGTTAHFEGIVLDQTAIALGTGASINGRLMAQTAVTLQSNAVVEP